MTPRLLRCADCGHESLITDDRCGGLHDMREVAAPAPALDAESGHDIRCVDCGQPIGPGMVPCLSPGASADVICGCEHPDHPGTKCRRKPGHAGEHATARYDVTWDNAYLSSPEADR